MKKYILKFKWVIAGLCIVLLMVAGKNFFEAQSNAVTVPKEQAVQVKRVVQTEKKQALHLTGTIEAEDNLVITSKYGGKVEGVLVENGETVSVGQSLLLMDQIQQQNALTEAKNALEKAQANLKYSQATYERMAYLYDAGAISKNDYDNAELGYRVASADVNLAQAALSDAQDAVQDTKVQSQIDGTVADCNIKTGEMIAAGTPLMTIQNLSSVYLVVNINQDDIAKMSIGQKVQVSSDSLSGKTWEGVIEIINPVANSASRSFEAKIRIDNSGQLLKPGMFAKADITYGAPVQVIAAPQSAVSGKDGIYYVFVAKGNSAERRTVELGDTTGQEVEVKSGLSLREQLIISNVNKLKDGDAIQISGKE